MGAGLLQAVDTLDEAEEQLQEAVRLAGAHHLTATEAHSRFELGNLLAQRGRLQEAVASYEESIRLSQESGEQVQLIVGYNNAAYHSLLLGKIDVAEEYIEKALALAESGEYQMPLQYLYSTRGEVALARQEWDVAERWLRRGLAEAQRQGNMVQVANYHANLSLVERGRGNLDDALLLLDEASATASRQPAVHLQIQIDLWLTELFLQRGEHAAASDSLARAETRLLPGQRQRLLDWAARLRQQVEDG
jgi:tetratricopeptide (TPR) repeat protein